MFSIKADNIYDVAQPLHQCSRLFGLTSFSVKYEDQRLKASTDIWSVFSILFTIPWSLICISLYYLMPIDDLNVHNIWISETSEVGMTFLFCGILISTNLAIWWTFMARNHFSKLLNLMLKLDDDLSKIKSPLNFGKHKKIIWVFVTIINLNVVTSIGSAFLMGHPMNFSYFVCMILFTVCTLMNIILIIHFTFWIWAIKIRYEKVNHYLEEHFSNITEGIEKLNASANFHATLVDSSDLINKCYGLPVDLFKKKKILKNYLQILQMATTMANSFLYVIMSLFCMARFWIQMGSEAVKQCLSGLVWIFLYSCLLYSVMHMGHFTRREVFKCLST